MKQRLRGHWRDELRCERSYIACVAISFLFLSCDLLNTRDPQNPDAGNQTLPTAFTKEILIDNFQKSFQQKNIQEYAKLFTDSSFLFLPTQSALARYSAVFSSWNKTSESDYFRNAMTAIGAASSPQIFFINSSTIPYHSDSALYMADYTVFVPHTRANITIQFAGRSELYLSPNKNNIWTIYRWIDFETKKDSSWSELKGQFFTK